MHLFAGAGGGILADILLGHVPVCAVEIDHYCRQVLDQRQADGCLPWFPLFDDVREFDGRPWRGLVDVIAGGFPCTDISAAGKGAGIEGKESGLWREMSRIIGEVRPRFAFVENSPMLAGRGLSRVCGDLAEMGYDATWGIVSACMLGAPHARDRMFLVANSDENILRTPWTTEAERWPADMRFNGTGKKGFVASWWEAEPEPCSVDDGIPGLVDELRPYGNAQVPAVAALAWRIIAGDA